jgi:beta-lactam-binding protein with PASTA domain
MTTDTSISFTFELKPHCRVPNVNGKTFARAKKMIHSRNCSLGTITRAASLTVGKGHVISQKPRPGTNLRYLAKVNLAVSWGRR